MNKFVNISKDGGASQRVTRKAFETVWKPKGFAEVDPAAVVIQDVTGQPASTLGDKTREELDKVAVKLGKDPAEAKNKEEVLGMIEDAAGGK